MSKAQVQLRLTAAEYDGFKGVERHLFKKGDLVSLSPSQAKAFGDKFEDPLIQDELIKKAARDKVIRDKQEAADAEAADEQQEEIEAQAKREIAAEKLLAAVEALSDLELTKRASTEKDEGVKKMLDAELAKRKAAK